VRNCRSSTFRTRLRRITTPTIAAGLHAAVLLGILLVMPVSVEAHDPSAFGGLFRSRDGGATWFSANPGRIVSGAIALAVSPTEPNHVLLATDSGLLRSRNAGLDWSVEAPSRLVGPVFAVAFDADGRRALVSTETELFRCDDGQTWRAIRAPSGTLPARLLVPDGPGRLYLVGWQGLYTSDDWGASWNAVASPVPELPVTQIVVTARTRTVYAIAAARLWVMDDRTRTWRAADAGLSHGTIDVVSVEPGQPRRLWTIARGQIFQSEDGGTVWRPWGKPVEGEGGRLAVRGLALSVGARNAVLTTDRGLYRSADGVSWEFSADNLPGHLEAWPLVRDPTDPDTLYAGFALIPYPELWRQAVERSSALQRERMALKAVAASVAVLGLVALAAVVARRMLRRRDGRRSAPRRSSPGIPR